MVNFPTICCFTSQTLGSRAMAKVAKTLRSAGDHLQVGATVRNVYGDPVDVGRRTVIPIARVSYDFGAGRRARGSEDAESERGGAAGSTTFRSGGCRGVAGPDAACRLAGLPDSPAEQNGFEPL